MDNTSVQPDSEDGKIALNPKQQHFHRQHRQYLRIVFASGLCFIWILLYRNIVPNRHSPIAPSRVYHGFGLPKLTRGDANACSQPTTLQLNRSSAVFNEEYGQYGQGAINGTTCMKEILIYGTLNKMENYPELAAILNLFEESVGYSYTAHFVCPNQCAIGLRIGVDKEYFKNKDVVIFGMLPKDFAGQLDVLRTIQPLQGQTWIYYSTEPPFRVLRWIKDMALKDIRYHKLMTYHLDSEIPYPFGYFVKTGLTNSQNTRTGITDREDDLPGFAANKTQLITNKTRLLANKTRLIAWMVSNCEEVNPAKLKSRH